MKRRDFITLLGGTAATWSLAARAQQPDKTPKVGVLWRAASAEQEGSNFKSLVRGFSDLGYVEGRGITLEHRFANDTPDGFKSMAAEFAASKVDVLIGVGNSAASYAREATATIPIVFVLVADPVGSQLVKTLAQPGGNMTGLSSLTPEVFTKRLALLKDIVPTLSKVGFLFNANDQNSRPYMEGTQTAATELGLTAQTFEWHSVNDIGPAFDAMKRAGMQAFTTSPDGMAFAHRALIGQIALARNLPLAVWSREALKGGALMSYAADQDAICQRAAVFVDKILKGAKPAELPVEQPTKFEFLVNPRAAKALGLSIPEAVLKRADGTVE
jgi:putative tryptophan/tyrosine transport system substrate-binding protein